MRTFSSEINFVFIVAHIKLASSGICEAKHAGYFLWTDATSYQQCSIASHHGRKPMAFHRANRTSRVVE